MKVELLSLKTWLAGDIKQYGEMKTCPIWAGVLEANPNAWCGNNMPTKLWYSPRAGGVFAVPRPGTGFLYDESSDNLRLRIAASRKIFELNRSGKYPLITKLADLEELARRPRLGIQARVDELLLCVERLSGPISQPTQWALKQSGEVKEFTERCMAATECRDYQDLMWLVGAALDQGFLKRLPRVDHKAGTGTLYLLSGKGAMRLDRLRYAEPDSDKAFVAMWFDGEMDKVWDEAIKPGLHNAGFRPIRIDRKEHVNRIDEEIEAEIRQSRLIVADFTCGFADGKKDTAVPRGSVYFEAGLALGLRIPVIWTCREDLVEHLHFDTRQYNHLPWRENELDKFRESITHRVINVVGRGPIREGNR